VIRNFHHTFEIRLSSGHARTWQSKLASHIRRCSFAGKSFVLVDLQLVVVIKTGTVTRISYDKASTIIMHATFATTYKQMRRLSQRRCTMQEGCRQWGRTITGWCP